MAIPITRTGVSIALLVIFACGCGAPHKMRVTVIEKQYTPESIGVGSGISSDGKSTVVTTTVKPESFTVLLKFENGDVKALDVEARDYGAINKGDTLVVDVRWWGIASYERTPNER